MKFLLKATTFVVATIICLALIMVTYMALVEFTTKAPDDQFWVGFGIAVIGVVEVRRLLRTRRMKKTPWWRC